MLLIVLMALFSLRWRLFHPLATFLVEIILAMILLGAVSGWLLDHFAN